MGKKTVRRAILPLLLTLALSLSGCGSVRTAISKDEAKAAAEKASYVVMEQETSATIDGYLTGDLEKDTSMQMAFVSFVNEADAESFYKSMRDTYQERKGVTVKETNSDAYNTLTAEGGDLYYRMSRIKNTVLYAKGLVGDKTAADALFTEAKY